MKYDVWVTLHGSSAKTAGIVGTQHKRSRWNEAGRLEWIPVNDGSQQQYEFTARDDSEAFTVLGRLFNERNRGNRRPLSGKSYMRECRVREEGGK